MDAKELNNKTKAMSPPNIDNIPPEILTEIASKLRMPADALSLGMSCKAVWNTIGTFNNYFWFTWFEKAHKADQERLRLEQLRRQALRNERIQDLQAQLTAAQNAPVQVPTAAQLAHMVQQQVAHQQALQAQLGGLAVAGQGAGGGAPAAQVSQAAIQAAQAQALQTAQAAHQQRIAVLQQQLAVHQAAAHQALQALQATQLVPAGSQGAQAPQSNGQDDPDKDPKRFEVYNPGVDYYKQAASFMVGNVTLGNHREYRCQGCLSPGSGNIEFRFHGVKFCEYINDEGKLIELRHSSSEHRTYCQECIPFVTATNLDHKYLGVDLSIVRYADAPSIYDNVNIGRSSFTGKFYLLSDLKRHVESQQHVSIHDLKLLAADAEVRRVSENENRFITVAGEIMNLLETEKEYEFYRKGLFDRERWMDYLIREWSEFSKFCPWGLSDHEEKVRIFNHFFLKNAPTSRRNQYHHYHYNSTPMQQAQRAYKKYMEASIFGDFPSQSPLKSEEENDNDDHGSDVDPVEEWKSQLRRVTKKLLEYPITERKDRKEEDGTFLNKAIWHYTAPRKFTADQAQKAGFCAYCHGKKYYTPYGYAIHIFRNHRSRFYDKRWQFRATPASRWKPNERKSVNLTKTVQALTVDEFNALLRDNRAAENYGPVCFWDEEKQAMALKDGWANYILV